MHPETCGEVGSTHLTGSGSGLDAGSTSIGLPLSIHLNYSVFDCQWLFDGIHKEENPRSAASVRIHLSRHTS